MEVGRGRRLGWDGLLQIRDSQVTGGTWTPEPSPVCFEKAER